MDAIMDFILRDYDVPSLKMFARRQIFVRLEEVLPSWTTKLFVENLTLQEKYRNTNNRLEKLSSRVRRRIRRVQEAIHEMEYVSSKMEEIEIAIRDGRTTYAAGELRCLRNLDTGLRELKYWQNVISVSFHTPLCFHRLEPKKHN